MWAKHWIRSCHATNVSVYTLKLHEHAIMSSNFSARHDVNRCIIRYHVCDNGNSSNNLLHWYPAVALVTLTSQLFNQWRSVEGLTALPLPRQRQFNPPPTQKAKSYDVSIFWSNPVTTLKFTVKTKQELCSWFETNAIIPSTTPAAHINNSAG